MKILSVQNIPKGNNNARFNDYHLSLNMTVPQDEVSFGGKKRKPRKQDSEAINDGIYNIGDTSLHTSKSDLNYSSHSLSLDDISEIEDKALKNQDMELRQLEHFNLPVPEIVVPDLKIENLDIGIDKLEKSSMIKAVLAEVFVGIVVVGIIDYFMEKNKKNNKNIDTKA